MNVVKHLRNEVSKNAQFSRYGQARAAYLALGLGFCFATGVSHHHLCVFGVDVLCCFLQLALVISSSSLYLFGWFAMVQVVFHLCVCSSDPVSSLLTFFVFFSFRWEYTFNALFHPQKLTSSDFLLPWQHSPEFLCKPISVFCFFFT
jgi:hypothetical protein